MLRDEIMAAMKQAMKDKNQVALSTLRLIMAAMKDRDISARTADSREGIDDGQVRQMLQSMIKQRRDSISMYEQGGRLELAEQEQKEVEVISQFLPQQMSEDEMRDAIQITVKELGASSIKDMGNVMGALREKYPAQMDFAKAAGIIKEALA